MSFLSVRWAALAQAGAALAASAAPAPACAICLAAVGMTPGQKLDHAERAVLAVPDDAGGWRVVADIKGTTFVDTAALVDAASPDEGATVTLFLRDALGLRWSALGEVGAENADWLRSVALTPAPGAAADPRQSAEAWQTRLALSVSRLESEDPQIAGIAHGDLARAPYAALLDLGRTTTTAEVLRQFADEEHPTHRAAYIHMLGSTDEAAAAEDWIEEKIDAAWEAEDATDLAALLAADLELRGPARLGWIEERYLLDPSRGLEEVEAALLALRVHGETDGTVPRHEVVGAYERFVRARPPMAGFVAMELAEWGEWGATDTYVALLNAEAIPDPAGAFAALSYVQRSPDAAARSRLERPDG